MKNYTIDIKEPLKFVLFESFKCSKYMMLVLYGKYWGNTLNNTR